MTNTPHPHDDLLESYAMRRLGEEEAARFEEHLLACAACRDRLVEAEEFIATLREAVRVSEQASPKVLPFRAPRRLLWAPVGIAAGLILAMFLYQAPQDPSLEPAVLMLQPLRGPEEGVSIEADRPLVLMLEEPAEPRGPYRIEMVDSEGERILSGRPEPREGKLSIRSHGLRPGDYWLRLYAAGPAADQIHEYRVRVR